MIEPSEKLSKESFFNRFFVVIATVFSLVFGAQAGTPCPIAASANNHYLIDAAGNPFLLTADSAWSFIVNLNTADTAFFLNSRATNGFNAVLGSLVCVTYTGGRANGSMLDGTVPFTNSINGQFDLASVNLAYFFAASNAVSQVNANGMMAILDPLETGGFLACALTNGPAKCLAYGQFLGNFFKSCTNIIWMNGNDYNADDPNIAANDACMTNVAWGIKTTAPNQVQCVQISQIASPTDGMENPNWWSQITFSLGYSWSPQYYYIQHEYQRTNAIPEVLGEAHYEQEAQGHPASYNNTETGTPLVLRKQEWWTMTSGGCGQFYGNHYTWTFIPGWQSYLNDEAVQELGHWKSFFGNLQWWQLVPDINHAVVTAGYGQFSATGLVSTNDYVTTAWNTNGTVIVSYLPNKDNITVEMTKLSSPAIARWFDPTTGTYSPISGSPFPNAGTQNFTPPGNNSAGAADWVLLLETEPQIIAASFINSNFAVTFSTLWGQPYELQSSTNLTSGFWLPIVTNILGTGGSLLITDTNASNPSQRFYRIKWQP